ncbi:DMT family transporter [Micromonospora sp. CPCC 205539]|uniref:DMT family transporter n=1 Tax=Micromonospora sp. CPCC 205539 TaxID=3122408 RepID=UPI002FF19966
MVKIPSLSRRSEPAPTRDENLDGRVDGRDTVVGTDRDDSTGTGTGRSDEAERRANERAAVARAAVARPVEGEIRRAPVGATPTPTVERDSKVDLDEDRAPRRPDTTDRAVAADRAVVADHAVAADKTVAADRVTTDRPVSPAPERIEPEQPVVRGPKPRASMLATLGLVVAVAGALFVLTGTLAGYGIGLGAIGAVLSVLGLMATRRRHVAGKTDALLGVLIGLAAVVLGVLAMTGQFDWPTTDGDWVQRFREWLDSQFVDRF